MFSSLKKKIFKNKNYLHFTLLHRVWKELYCYIDGRARPDIIGFLSKNDV